MRTTVAAAPRWRQRQATHYSRVTSRAARRHRPTAGRPTHRVVVSADHARPAAEHTAHDAVLDAALDAATPLTASPPAQRLAPPQGGSVAKLWARQAHAAQVEAYALYFAMRDPQAPWFAKLVAAAAVGYVFSPIQLIPDWIPVIGCADDLAALGIALACMRWLTPQSVILACHERAEEAIAQRTWLARRRALVVVATIVLVALWLLIGTIGAIAIIRALSGGR